MRATTRAATAAEEANKLTRQVFIAGTRPWLKADVSLASPLTYTEQDSWHLGLRYVLTNVGNSPAIDVHSHLRMLPLVVDAWTEEMLQGRSPYEMPTLGADLYAEAKTLREEAERSVAVRGVTIFPGDSYTSGHGVHGDRRLFERAKELQTYAGQFQIVFGVSYDNAASGARHVTTKAFTIAKASDQPGKYGAIDLIGENIARDRLVLMTHEFGQTDVAT